MIVRMIDRAAVEIPTIANTLFLFFTSWIIPNMTARMAVTILKHVQNKSTEDIPSTIEAIPKPMLSLFSFTGGVGWLYGD